MLLSFSTVMIYKVFKFQMKLHLHPPPHPLNHTGYNPHPCQGNHHLAVSHTPHNCLGHYHTAAEPRRCDFLGSIVFSVVEREVPEFHFWKVQSPVL